MNTPLLSIEQLTVKVGEQTILSGLDLVVPPGQIHVLMGKNGEGKTTVAQVLAGAPDYEITQGKVTFQNQDLLTYTPEERAAQGLFVAFQSPLALPGVSLINFLKTSINAIRKAHGQDPLGVPELLAKVYKQIKAVGMDPSFLQRSLNDGFSGGEKKRTELLQMSLLAPKLAILDETDSGLDLDALRFLGSFLQRTHTPNRSFIIITHYAKLLEYITPDTVHIMHKGKIAHSGGMEIVAQLLKEGYDKLLSTAHP